MLSVARACVVGCLSVVLASAVGCGGSSSSTHDGTGGTTGGTGGGGTGGSIEFGTMCPAFTPCGGDIVGSWKVQSVCVAPLGVGSAPECADAIQKSSATGESVYDFSADGTLSISGTVMVDATVAITDACAQAGSGMSIDASGACTLIKLISSSGANGGTGDPTLNCTYEAPTCNCHVTGGTTPADETYTVMGTSLTITDAQGTAQTSDYCVSGQKLTIRSTGTIGQQISVLARQ